MTVWQRVKLQEWTAGISVAGESAAISPCFRYPKMASEAPGVGGGVSPSSWLGRTPRRRAPQGRRGGTCPPLGGRPPPQGKPKFVAGPDPTPAGLPRPERGHLPPLGVRPPSPGKPNFGAGQDPAPAGLPEPERGHPPPRGGGPPSQVSPSSWPVH